MRASTIPRVRRAVRVARCASLALLVACGGGGSGGSGSAPASAAPTRRDSAGVTLVTDPVPYGLPDAPSSAPHIPEWTVPDAPELTLGKAEGDGPQVFGRISDAARLPDGTVVVADGQAGELRAFDASGRHLWTRGGKGGGPREFRSLQDVAALPGDTIAAWDPMASHLALLTPDGTFAAGYAAHASSGQMSFSLLYGFLSGRRAVTSGGFSPQTMMEAGDGVRRDTVALLVRSAEGSAADTLAMVPGRETEISHDNGGFQSNAVLFGRASHMAAAAGRVWVGDDDRWEIDALDPDGKVRVRIRMDREPRRVSDEAIAAERKRRIAELKREMGQMGPGVPAGFVEQMSKRIQTATVRHTLPAFADLKVDASGDVWVKESAVDPDGPGRWIVLEPDGSLLALASVPAGFHVLQTGADYVLGRTEDDLGVQRVVLYRWRKGGGE